MLAKRTIIPLAVALAITIVAVIGISTAAFLDTNGGPATSTVTIFGSHARLYDLIDLPLYLLAATLLPGVVTYVITRRDFPAWGAALATAGCVILMVVGAWLGFVFAFFAYFAAPIVYLGMRHLLRARPALSLALATVTLLASLALAVDVMGNALNNM